MNYLLKEKIIRPGFKVQEVVPRIILINEPSEVLSEIYSRQFNRLEFIAHQCPDHKDLIKKITELEPNLLTLSITKSLKKPSEFIKQILKKNNGLNIITTSEGQEGVDMKNLISAGVAGHINKSLSRPVDLVLLASHVLQLK